MQPLIKLWAEVDAGSGARDNKLTQTTADRWSTQVPAGVIFHAQCRRVCWITTISCYRTTRTVACLHLHYLIFKSRTFHTRHIRSSNTSISSLFVYLRSLTHVLQHRPCFHANFRISAALLWISIANLHRLCTTLWSRVAPGIEYYMRCAPSCFRTVTVSGKTIGRKPA